MQEGTPVAGRYRLVELLGAGGMGEVWRADDEVLHRTVAVKVVLPALHSDPEFGRRFLSEARAMASVRHPGVVSIHDFGETDGKDGGKATFLVMEFVAGESLSTMLRRLGRLSPALTMDLVAQTAQALQAVHNRGIVHRDIKPANLMVRPAGTVALTDFGIAAGHLTTGLTRTGMMLGTPQYLAPEQVLGEPATAKSDVYALGLVAFECLTGQRPFTAEEPIATALKRVQNPAPPLPADVPPEVAGVVARALATDPAQRWQTAAELAHAAKQSLTSTSPADPPAGEPAARHRHRAPAAFTAGLRLWKRHRRAAIIAGAVVVLVVAGAVTLSTATGDRPPAGQRGQHSTAPTLGVSDGTAPGAQPSGSPDIASSGVPPGGVPVSGPARKPAGGFSITGPGDRTDTVGTAIKPVRHTLSGGKAPYTWTVTGLPLGLSIDLSTGTVSGTPNTARTYAVTAKVRDSSLPSKTASVSYSWTIKAAPRGTCSGSNGTAVSIPSMATEESTIYISGCTGKASTTSKIEVHITHAHIGDLKVVLVGPFGDGGTLHNKTGGDTDNINRTYTMNLSSATVINGMWHLRVENLGSPYSGTINSWKLTL
jgi:hypothetical protein